MGQKNYYALFLRLLYIEKFNCIKIINFSIRDQYKGDKKIVKIKLSSKELYEAVVVVSRAVSSKASIPALEGILMKAFENRITLVGYDLNFGITTTVPANVEENGSIILNSKLFLEIVRSVPGESISITVGSDNMVKVESGNSEFSIVGISPDEFPDIPRLSEHKSVNVGETVLKNMVKKTIFAVSQTDIKPVLKGVLFEVNTNELKLVAIDGYRMALRREPIKCEEEFKFVVPARTLQEILKMLPDESEDEVTIQVAPKHIIFRIGKFQVFSRLLEGEFINYEMALPKVTTTTVKAETISFVHMIERMSLLINERTSSPIHCFIEDDSIKVSCQTAIGKASDMIKASIDGETVIIAFNNRYMQEALRAVETTDVKIEMSTPLSPIVLKPIDGDDFIYLILPVKIRND